MVMYRGQRLENWTSGFDKLLKEKNIEIQSLKAQIELLESGIKSEIERCGGTVPILRQTLKELEKMRKAGFE